MYSRTPVPPPHPRPMGRPSYVRTHNLRSDFRVPLNYSGNAFPPRMGDDDGYVTLPQDHRREDRPEEPTDAPFAEETFDEPAAQESPEPSEPPMAAPKEPARAVMNLQHFPFGHGIGFEELLLLGLIFFLLQEGEGQEDRGDLDETVLLLAILLFCG